MRFDEISKTGWTVIGILLALLLISWLSCGSGSAQAAELSHARDASAFAGGSAGVDTVAVTTGSQSRNDLPSAYLFYSGDGASFWIGRYDLYGALESVPIKIPANSSIMIPAPDAQISGSTYIHQFYINASSVTDSVYVIPFDR